MKRWIANLMMMMVHVQRSMCSTWNSHIGKKTCDRFEWILTHAKKIRWSKWCHPSKLSFFLYFFFFFDWNLSFWYESFKRKFTRYVPFDDATTAKFKSEIGDGIKTSFWMSLYTFISLNLMNDYLSINCMDL